MGARKARASQRSDAGEARKLDAFGKHPSFSRTPQLNQAARRRQPEQELQRSVIAHLQWRARPGVWWTHVPLGGLRSKIEAKILRGLGTTRGTPDLLIVAAGRAHFLELKAPHGRVTPEQHECHERLRAAGAEVAAAFGIDDALRVLEAWGLLRGHTS